MSLEKEISAEELQAEIDRQGFGWSQLLTIILCGGIMFAEGSEMLVMGSITTLLHGHWDLSALVRGTMVSVVFLGFCVGNLLSGVIGDRLGRRVSILLSYFLIAVFGLATAYAVDAVSMICLRFLVGVGCGVGFPSVYTMMPEVCPLNLRSSCNTAMIGIMPLGELFASFGVWSIDPELDRSQHHCDIFGLHEGVPASFLWGKALADDAAAIVAVGGSGGSIERLDQQVGGGQAGLGRETAAASGSRPRVDETGSAGIKGDKFKHAAGALLQQVLQVGSGHDAQSLDAREGVGIAGLVSAPLSAGTGAASLFAPSRGGHTTSRNTMLSRERQLQGSRAGAGAESGAGIYNLLFAEETCSWRMLCEFSALPAFVFFVFSFLYLEESPHYLLAKKRTAQGAFYEKLEELAAGEHDVAVAASAATPRQPQPPGYAEDATFAAPRYSKNSAELAKTLMKPAFLHTTLFLFVCHFTKDFAVFGLAYVFPQFFASGILLAFYFAQDPLIGHRTALMTFSLVSACAAAGMLDLERQFADFSDILQLPCAYLLKCSTLGFFVMTVVITAETFPTSIRNSAVGLCTAVGRGGSISAPLVFEVLHSGSSSFNGFLKIVGVLMLAIGCSVRLCLARETKGTLVAEDGELLVVVGNGPPPEGEPKGSASDGPTKEDPAT
eukprot:g4154.t1